MYEVELERIVMEAAASVSTLAELVSRARGAFPTDVAAAAKRLGVRVFGTSESLQTRPGPPIHPLDYDWRFSAQTVAHMHTALGDVASSVVFICCPSMCVDASEWGRVALIDRNAQWSRWMNPRVEFTIADLAEAPEEWRDCFDAALLDPPWYEPEFYRGLFTAAKVVRLGGTILVSWPGPLTRPGLRDEWNRFVVLATEFGLDIESTEQGCLTYATPFFEGLSMRAAGLPVLAEWRRADLVRCVRARRTLLESDMRPSEPTSSAWIAQRLGQLPIRLAQSAGDVVDPRLVSLIGGDILPSVSRRDPLRAAARVWTSGNRVFHCERPDVLAVVVENLVNDPLLHVEATLGRKLAGKERRLVEKAVVQIRNLEVTEATEYNLLHGITHPTAGSRRTDQNGTR